MATDIVPIELGLPQGDVVTLWAPRWREEGEEWEAFLGHDDDLYAFSDTAALAAFVRTVTEHDLADHPAWHVVPALSVAELIPDDGHQYDLVGVPELIADEPDTWVLSELADIVAIVRSLADVCELDEVHEVLDSATGFGLLGQGTLPFTGREGTIIWTELAEVVSERWDEVLDAIDDVVTAPSIKDKDALSAAQAELAEVEALAAEAADRDDGDDGDLDAEDVELVDAESDESDVSDGSEESEEDTEDTADAEDAEPLGFWGEVGIDPIKIITDDAEYYTLRCYLEDDDSERPLFLGANGTIEVFRSARTLKRYLADASGQHNDLAEATTWTDVLTAATDGSLDIKVDPGNTYVLPGLADDIGDGPDAVDPTQLDLAVELLTDAADWAGDKSVGTALAPSETLGWLVSFVLRPDPTRLAPGAPFDAEVTAWQKLVDEFTARLHAN
ncbi:MAG TPA: primosomal protein [Pseudonocardiaceae bacterium]|jgi:hypothetical protein|nr:primosomal protein [Pseudonocardiaceae bacterium]